MTRVNPTNSFWTRVFKIGPGRRLARWVGLLPAIEEEENAARKLSDEKLRKANMALRYRARTGESLERLLVPAYGLVREAARRTVSMRHFDVQVLAAIAIYHDCFVEMQTGEGKTLTATMPVTLHALNGKNCHVVTANDYLAERDAELMRPVYEALGLTVGALQPRLSQAERRDLYARDVTYGTFSQFGFDFLRDALRKATASETGSPILVVGRDQAKRAEENTPVQRGHHFALVDEADAVLIDSARGTLTVHAPSDTTPATPAAHYRWAAEIARGLAETVDYAFDRETKRTDLTRAGRRKVRQAAGGRELEGVGLVEMYRQVQLAVLVRHAYTRDRNYIVTGGRVKPLNERTGRPTRRGSWSGGVQQAIQAKEGLNVTDAVGSAARITIQDYFRRYQRLAGMSGTLNGCEREIKRTYGCHTFEIPTNRPSRRAQWPDLVLGTQQAKWNAIVAETRQLHDEGRPVLIGTCTITSAECISKMLTENGIAHQVLHGHHVRKEARVIARAGQLKAVTVATSMAGRGTDIQLGPGVAELGGLHVICADLHTSPRLDRQLQGRCARQGDPGTYRQFLALDDEILTEGLGEAQAGKYRDLGQNATSSLDRFAGVFRRAQRKIQQEQSLARQRLQTRNRSRGKRYREMGRDPHLDL